MSEKVAIMLGQRGHGKTTLAECFGKEAQARGDAWTFWDGNSEEYLMGNKQGKKIDCGILVVDVMEGLSPQTREHILLAAQLGVKKVFVFINKCEVARGDTFEVAQQVLRIDGEVRELLSWYDFNGSPIYWGSALTKMNWSASTFGVKPLYEALIA